MQLQSTNTVTVQPHAIIYGPAKSGKTRLIPTLEAPVICSTDLGLASIREHNLPFFECTKWDQVAEFMQWVRTGGAHQFKTIVFDDLTEMCDLYLLKALRATKDGRQAYGLMQDEIMAFIREVRALHGATVVMLCKEERIQDANLNLIYSPRIPGKAVAPMLAYLVGQIYRMETYTDPATGKVHEVLRCKRNSMCEAGDRSGKLSEIEFADLGAINRKVMS